MTMSFLQKFYFGIISRQPFRVLGKSLRNIFLPRYSNTAMPTKTIHPFRVLGKSLRNIFVPGDSNAAMPTQTITIEISSVCNARCIFCTYRLNLRKKTVMSVDMFNNIIASAIECGFDNLIMTPLTGETFLHKDAVHMIADAKKAGFKAISVFTNGINLNQHDLSKLLMSGLDTLSISFPGFSDIAYNSIFGVREFDQFKDSISKLLTTHEKLKSDVKIIFCARSNLTKDQIKQSDYYNLIVSKFISDKIYFDEPVKVFDSWLGMIKRKDMPKGMKLDINPLKSIYPLKKTFVCERLLIVGVLANGDVRLCNCRCDDSIGTERDSLFIANLAGYRDLKELLHANANKIDKIKEDFVRGKLPSLCRKCPFYSPYSLNNK